ncbi:hypothetical protein RB195_024973 [Necator americanus]|uniref:Uncharacterized protein n=1 Tax=Necator americanus TaxID=51031 RepID=A0ABR1EQE6_NECAM
MFLTVVATLIITPFMFVADPLSTRLSEFSNCLNNDVISSLLSIPLWPTLLSMTLKKRDRLETRYRRIHMIHEPDLIEDFEGNDRPKRVKYFMWTCGLVVLENADICARALSRREEKQ